VIFPHSVVDAQVGCAEMESVDRVLSISGTEGTPLCNTVAENLIVHFATNIWFLVRNEFVFPPFAYKNGFVQ